MEIVISALNMLKCLIDWEIWSAVSFVFVKYMRPSEYFLHIFRVDGNNDMIDGIVRKLVCLLNIGREISMIRSESFLVNDEGHHCISWTKTIIKMNVSERFYLRGTGK